MMIVKLIKIVNSTLLITYDVLVTYMHLWSTQQPKDVLAPAVQMTYATLVAKAKKTTKDLKIPISDVQMPLDTETLPSSLLAEVTPNSYEAQKAYLELNQSRIAEQEAAMAEVIQIKRFKLSRRVKNIFLFSIYCINILMVHNFIKILLTIAMAMAALQFRQDEAMDVTLVLININLISKIITLLNFARKILRMEKDIDEQIAAETIISIVRIISNLISIIIN